MADLAALYGASGFNAGDYTHRTDLADPVGAFRQAAEAAGLYFWDDDVIGDGNVHRCWHRDDKKRTRSKRDCWYVLHLDGEVPIGVFGSFKEFEFQEKWIASHVGTLSFAEQARHRQLIAEAARKREEARRAAHAEAAQQAEEDLASMAIAGDDHPYLIRRGVKAHGIKVDRAGALVVPFNDPDGNVTTYQKIPLDGPKRYLKDGKKKGAFFEFRGRRDTVFIGEGWVTCATVFEATGCTVLSAGDTASLSDVAETARKLFPAARVVIAADNDHKTPGNPGLAAAASAAKLCRGEVVHPVFTDADKARDEATSDWNDLLRIHGGDEVIRQLGGVTQAARPGFEFVRAGDLELTEIDWLVDDYLEADSLAQFFGDPGCGKSFVAIDIACSVATGTPWHGREVRQGAVFYIAGEGHNGLARRLRAWQDGKGIELSGAPIWKSTHAAQLYDATEAALVSEAIRSLSDSCGVTPSLIVIDTLARNMGADENSTEDMNAFIAHLDMYLRRPWNCTVIVVHHSGAQDKDRSRGSTALRGALDAEYKVELDGTSAQIRVTPKKMKEAEMPAGIVFQLTQIELPIKDRRGDPVKGAHLVSLDVSGLMQQANAQRDFLAKNQRRALEILAALEHARAEDPNPQPIGRDEFREACADGGVPRNRFKEALDALISKGIVEEYSTPLWCVRIRPNWSDSDDFGRPNCASESSGTVRNRPNNPSPRRPNHPLPPVGGVDSDGRIRTDAAGIVQAEGEEG